jgi:hypothetical protein
VFTRNNDFRGAPCDTFGIYPNFGRLVSHDTKIMFRVSGHFFSATHLSNQCYSFCFRRSAGNCGICFSPTIIATTIDVISQVSKYLSFFFAKSQLN